MKLLFLIFLILPIVSLSQNLEGTYVKWLTHHGSFINFYKNGEFEWNQSGMGRDNISKGNYIISNDTVYFNHYNLMLDTVLSKLWTRFSCYNDPYLDSNQFIFRIINDLPIDLEQVEIKETINGEEMNTYSLSLGYQYNQDKKWILNDTIISDEYKNQNTAPFLDLTIYYQNTRLLGICENNNVIQINFGIDQNIYLVRTDFLLILGKDKIGLKNDQSIFKKVEN